MNITFENEDGSDIYYAFIESYSQIVNQCVEDEDESDDSIYADITKSDLHLCSSCSDFLSQESDANKYKYVQFLNMITVVVFVYFNL